MASLKIIVLNSGSNGNAVYVESANTQHGVLLDCGISRKQIELRLKVHGRFMNKAVPVFLTHEHADHARGLSALAKAYQTQSYMTERTYRNLWSKSSVKGFNFIKNDETVEHEDLRITAFAKSHDAADPVGFIVETGDTRFLYATDLGVADEDIRALLPTVDAAMIESNYDLEMLLNGSYPEWLKDRVQSDVGHLSNKQAASLVEECCDGRLKALIYGHLSENNNSTEAVQREWESLRVRKPGFNPDFHIASRYDVGEIISI
jgi:phosphoribosyl 1,2-cyclic phosphodiesterase